MPLYTLKRISTGEEWDVNVPFDDLAQILEDADIVKVLSTPKFSTSGTKDNITRAGSEWRDLLGRVKKGSGRKNTIKL
jgi:hypothetical protein